MAPVAPVISECDIDLQMKTKFEATEEAPAAADRVELKPVENADFHLSTSAATAASAVSAASHASLASSVMMVLGLRKEAFMVAVGVATTLFVGMYTLGYYVLDLGHEEETWRLTATDETWSANNAVKWQSTGTSPTGDLDLLAFRKYYCILTWVTGLISGFGSEALIGLFLLENLAEENLVFFWKVAQFVFPLLISIAIQTAGQQSPICYVFMVLGMWKFGFPETLVYLTRILRCEKTPGGLILWMSDFCNAFGTLMHHTCAALILCTLQNGLAPLSPAILACCAPCVMQHWLVMLKYVNLNAYALLEICLEILFEWEIFSNLQRLGGTSTFIWMGAMGMLLAHWFYWTGAILSAVGQAMAPAVEQHRGSIHHFTQSLSQELVEHRRMSAMLEECRRVSLDGRV